MIPKILLPCLAALFTGTSAYAQEAERTEPFTAAERESVYNTSIEKRASDILKELDLSDTNKVTRVHDAIIAQYRALRARDEAMDDMFQALSKNAPGIETNRSAILGVLSKQLHDRFLARLAAELTPEQVDVVKDRMTYKKVKVTYDAYCEIVPGLTEAEKAKILAMLKEAREVAMDGGTASEKSDVFEEYKGRINNYLSANGHDIAKAYKEWEARRAAQAQAPTSAPK